jgi:hypothetical protein
LDGRKVRGRKRLHRLVVEIIVVEEDRCAIGQQTEIRLEPVGACTQGLIERCDRVLRKPPRTAAVAENEKVTPITSHSPY